MQPQNPSSKKTGIMIAIGVVVVVVLIIFFFEHGSSSDVAVTVPSDSPAAATTPPPTTTPITPVAPVDVPKQTTSVYKDGTYTAVGSYMSPGGADKVTLSLTLANDIITNATVTSGAGDSTSAHYQKLFISGFKQFVVGKNIASVKLTVVSGSSLTPIGFNDALNQIKTQAKA